MTNDEPGALQCSRCGAEIDYRDAEDCIVSKSEAYEFGLRPGELICTMCFHLIKWPHLETDAL